MTPTVNTFPCTQIDVQVQAMMPSSKRVPLPGCESSQYPLWSPPSATIATGGRGAAGVVPHHEQPTPFHGSWPSIDPPCKEGWASMQGGWLASHFCSPQAAEAVWEVGLLMRRLGRAPLLVPTSSMEEVNLLARRLKHIGDVLIVSNCLQNPMVLTPWFQENLTSCLGSRNWRAGPPAEALLSEAVNW